MDRPSRIPEDESTRLGLVGVGFVSLPAMFLREEIRRWRFHNIVPDIARQPCRDERAAALGPAGEKLASILRRMSNDDLDAISRGLRAIVPGFKEVQPRLSMDGTLTFRILEDKLKTGINPASASDGTVRLLALLVATTWSVRNSTLITIEEPENGVHPHLAEYLVEILRSASQQCQIVVTTHAPDLLDHLEPHEVILCDKEDGFTRLRKASGVRDIEQFRRHFSLGELWSQGAIGAMAVTNRRWGRGFIRVGVLEKGSVLSRGIWRTLPPSTSCSPWPTTQLRRKLRHSTPSGSSTQLWKEHRGQSSALNKIDFARTMAPLFDPEQGRQRSASFDYFWTRLKTKLQSP